MSALDFLFPPKITLPEGGTWVEEQVPINWLYRVLGRAWDGIVPPSTGFLLDMVQFAREAERQGGTIATYRLAWNEGAANDVTCIVANGKIVGRLDYRTRSG